MALEKHDIELVAKELGGQFEELQKKNDKRIDAIEQEKGKLADSVSTLADEVKSLNKLKEDLEAELKKQNKPTGGEGGEAAAQHKQAFTQFVRKGAVDGLEDLEHKALNLGSDADGGYAVPEELDRNILQLLRDGTPMRSVCHQMTVGGDGYRRLVDLHGTSSGWVGETAARPVTGSPKLAEIKPFMGEIYANPQTTQKALDDMFFDAEVWLSSGVALEFMEKENAAFTSGDATNKPKGFLAYDSDTQMDKDRDFGTLQHVETIASGAIGADDVTRFIYQLKAGYRQGAVWMGAGALLADLMVLKDGNGQYLWRPGLEVGESSTLRGYRFVENEDMPAVAAGAKALSFGNFQRGYTIVDRMGTRMLRDPYTNKPYVGFYTTKRVGGFVTDSQAIKLMQIKA